MSGAGRARVGHTPVLISSKPHEMTISGQTSVAVVLVVVMVLVNALDGLCAATLAARLDTTQGEHATLCHFCGQPGHTVAKCPSKPANEAWGFGAEMNLTGTGFVSACHTQYAPYVPENNASSFPSPADGLCSSGQARVKLFTYALKAHAQESRLSGQVCL
ncbi:hypothetical protein H257_19105 [Aphanomyces astaci]|uniref:CCHC-type domain-containing protein n=1 Tax=Aphanomyces astaci TaxID=112090 RepID=W4FAK7_APHAT|nr:hypothetical protein H257_19105 [Aphanomyces astaci]ETV63959.1 hypothetical protein H257_19105 [Aphanomyces astaci]|eukprot:XP_009846556.1 hypothetical protein H257_19105 [Aphanomyces astaci]